ncbi:kinetochore protein Mis12/MTW1 [Blastomyces parvus]|uniref:Kinetochore protein Mis12/MTW1 n=1 Tax=Blastomyces parvus TaxID=2060905 RepID=A0A2B7WTB5_9EURO|nr:kinetochore protein Mis12/MTW1 [Blastomyces parvus]
MNDTTTALLTEHFSYTPLSLIDDVINSINNLVYQAISSLEDGLLNAPPERLGFSHAPDTIPDTDDDGNIQYPEARLEIENGLHQLETLLEATVDKAFDKFEIYVLRNILTVPEDLLGWVRLKHYEKLSLGPGSPNAPTLESITLQRQKLRETRKLQRALRQESDRNDAVIAQLRSILFKDTHHPHSADEKDATALATHSHNAHSTTTADAPDLSFLLTDPIARRLRIGDAADPSRNPITTNTTFILSQLHALRSMVAQLRPKLTALPNSADDMELDPRREERRAYIESRTRMHLVRNGELGRAGEGHGVVVAGRRVEGEEVRALEGVVGMLGDD